MGSPTACAWNLNRRWVQWNYHPAYTTSKSNFQLFIPLDSAQIELTNTNCKSDDANYHMQLVL